MKILLTIHHDLNPNTGAPGSTMKIGQEYEKLGHKIQYYSLDNLPNWIKGKAKSLLFPWCVAFYILKLCKQQAVDVIDASTGDAWVWTILRNFQKNSPLLVTRSHGLDHIVDLVHREEERRGNLKLSWQYKLYGGGFRLWEVATSLRYADLVFQLNRRDLEYGIENLGVKTEKSHMVANGIPEIFLNLPFDPTPKSENSTISIALVSSYIPRKGINYSVPALNSILQRYPHVKVSFLGTGCSEKDVLADFNPAVKNRVLVVPSYKHEMLPTLLKGHQIKLFPSLSEGFGKAIIEAMACGLAPIATAIPGSIELVRDEHDGILIPPRDSLAIEQALEHLITDHFYLEQMRRNAQIKAQSYSWTHIAKHRLSLYQEALAKENKVLSLSSKK